MSRDPGAAELKALLEAPSLPLEEAIDALGATLETAHGAEAGGAKLPESARGPITQLQGLYRQLLRRVGSIETGNPGRRGAMKAIQRMESGLGNLATAIGLEGEEAEQEAGLGADQMERAGTELQKGIARLG
ncbi:MAG: hypothetical protein JST59_27690 [Actinobacteria bacterium]|nr:hypothetical protein [Actinomycetota bacterium]